MYGMSYRSTLSCENKKGIRQTPQFYTYIENSGDDTIDRTEMRTPFYSKYNHGGAVGLKVYITYNK